MRSILALTVALALALASGACTADRSDQAARPSPTPTSTEPPAPDNPPDEALIYAAVIRQLITKDHTFGGGKSPFSRVYVVDGVIEKVSSPRTDLFDRPAAALPQDVRSAIRERTQDLPSLTFVDKGRDAIRAERSGEVKGMGVVIALGPILDRDGEVHVPNALWCGGLCAQWLTYVVKKTEGRWKITGTTGPYVIS